MASKNFDDDLRTYLLGLRANVAALHFNVLLHLKAAEQKFNPHWPTQPRAPRGTSDGGQWVGNSSFAPRPKPSHLPKQEPPSRGPGDNRPPPEADSLQEVFPTLANSPAGAIVAPIDSFLGISATTRALIDGATANLRDNLVAEIRAIDPTYQFSSAEPGGLPRTPEGWANMYYALRFDRASALYRMRGETRPLQVEMLRQIQFRVDRAYAEGLRRYRAGLLDVHLSKEEAIGNFMDGQVRQSITNLMNSRRIPFSDQIRVIGREYTTSESDRTYRVPDARVGNVVFDWTLTRKTSTTRQIRGFFSADAGFYTVAIVRPSQLTPQPVYLITRPSAR